MAKELFVPYRPHAATLVVVEQANSIIEEYQAQGFALTVRQLFYQFVARALLPNTFNDYKRLGRIVRDARDGGLIDWSANRGPHPRGQHPSILGQSRRHHRIGGGACFRQALRRLFGPNSSFST